MVQAQNSSLSQPTWRSFSSLMTISCLPWLKREICWRSTSLRRLKSWRDSAVCADWVSLSCKRHLHDVSVMPVTTNTLTMLMLRWFLFNYKLESSSCCFSELFLGSCLFFVLQIQLVLQAGECSPVPAISSPQSLVLGQKAEKTANKEERVWWS